MKRTLISYDAFERMEKDSLSSAESELCEAQEILGRMLDLDHLELRHFGQNNVIYETIDGNFIHANYQINEGQIQFNKIEELVIDEESGKEKSKDLVSNMVDALLDDENKLAEDLFVQYMELPNNKRAFNETKVYRAAPVYKTDSSGKRKRVGTKRVRWDNRPKSAEPSSKTRKRVIAKKKNAARRSEGERKRWAIQNKKWSRKSKMNELASLVENVSNYIDYKSYGVNIDRSQVQLDEKGDVSVLKIPSSEAKYKNKLEKFKWDVLSADNTIHRMSGLKLGEDFQFAKKIAELKRHNALSDNDALEEALGNIVTKWPDVIYLTQNELSQKISEALESVGSNNYDTQMCDFMAEGILRMAHDAYVDRVNKIQKWAGVNPEDFREGQEDPYAVFKYLVEQFYPQVDENNYREMQVYIDLYEAFRDLREIALEENQQYIRTESEMYLNQLVPVIRGEVMPNLELAVAATEYLQNIVETNLETQTWNPSNSVHTTVGGDHPRMAQNARHSYNPASDFSGDWGDSAPVSDGKNYKGGLADQMRSNSYGNVGGGDVYPVLQNPYVPKSFGDYEIKGEPHIDDDGGQLAHSGGSDTWPRLQNPYVPASVTPYTYKMNHGKEPDLVVDQ